MGLMYVSQNSPEGRATTCGHCAVPILEGNDLYGVDKDYCCLPRLSHTKTALQFGFWKAASRHFVLQVATLRSVKGHVPAILSSSRASWLYRDVDTTAECGIVSISSPSFPVSPRGASHGYPAERTVEVHTGMWKRTSTVQSPLGQGATRAHAKKNHRPPRRWRPRVLVCIHIWFSDLVLPFPTTIHLVNSTHSQTKSQNGHCHLHYYCYYPHQGSS
jgi:hypothetical protein